MQTQEKTSGLGQFLVRFTGILFVVGLGAVAVLLVNYQQFKERPVNLPADEQQVVLKQGWSLGEFARELNRLGVIDQPRFFVFLGREMNAARKLHAGEFIVRRGMTPRDVLQLATDGKVVQYSITLIEGQTFREMLARIQSNEAIRTSLDGMAPDEIMAKLGYPGQHPEGRFLADTYYFPRNTSDLDVLQRAYRAMQLQLAAAWQERAADLPFRNPDEALVLASIVEKETGKASERPIIAGVFVRRLEKGMRLQTDPTVIYGLGDRFDGNLRRRDLRTDTPYNTYTRHGLPPTPIAMPGAAALEAVMHPADGDSLYFVSRGDGSHYFSATLKEHELAVDKFQRGKKGVRLPGEGKG